MSRTTSFGTSPNLPSYKNTFRGHPRGGKWLVDEMAKHCHTKLPGVPCGPTLDYDIWEPATPGQYFYEIDFTYCQYTRQRALYGLRHGCDGDEFTREA